MTVDTEKYLDFVAGVTSPASSDYAELLRRLSELEVEACLLYTSPSPRD